MVTDANNKATTFLTMREPANFRNRPKFTRDTVIYDARNSASRTTYHDGSNRHLGMTDSGVPLVDTDQAGKTTTRAYDAEGQLSGITDALNQSSNTDMTRMGTGQD